MGTGILHGPPHNFFFGKSRVASIVWQVEPSGWKQMLEISSSAMSPNTNSFYRHYSIRTISAYDHFFATLINIYQKLVFISFLKITFKKLKNVYLLKQKSDGPKSWIKWYKAIRRCKNINILNFLGNIKNIVNPKNTRPYAIWFFLNPRGSRCNVFWKKKKIIFWFLKKLKIDSKKISYDGCFKKIKKSTSKSSLKKYFFK